MPGLNLEIWGLPTSEPTYDPNNGGFIYLRFQRGIMHYDAACRGTQTFFSEGRPYTDRNRALAELVQGNLAKALAEAGYSTNDRRATTDSSVLGGKSHYYLLGPAGDPIKRASTMPAIIGEALYLTNDADANALRQERILDALAKGYTEAVKQFFTRFPVG